MRNTLITAAAVLLLLLFSFIGWLEYRQYQSFRVPVHSGIHSVLRIHTDALVREYLLEFGFGSSGKRNRPKDSTKIKTGLYLPANLFVYDLDEAPGKSFYCSLPLHNLENFKKFSGQKWNLQWRDSAGTWISSVPGRKISLACNKDYVSICFSRENLPAFANLQSILKDRHQLNEDKTLLEKLKSAKQQFYYTDGSNTLSANISKQQLVVQGNLPAQGWWSIPVSSKLRTTLENSFAALTLNGVPGKGLLKEKYKMGNNELLTDSILAHYDGYADVHIGAPTMQRDTIISYAYNDDFEMTEKKEIREVKVPSVQLTIKAKEGMLQYLKATGFITAKMQLSKELFPLYQVFVTTSPLYLHFSTSTTPVFNTSAVESSAYFLSLDASPTQTASALELPTALQGYLGGLQLLRLRGSMPGKEAVIDVTLQFKDPVMMELRRMLPF